MKRLLRSRLTKLLSPAYFVVSVIIAVVLFLYWVSQGIISSILYQAGEWVISRMKTPGDFFLAVVILGILVVLIGGYRYHWAWTGLESHTPSNIDGQAPYARKTLWDWMQLLVIPAVLAGGALFFNFWNTTTQNAIAADNQREAALQTYIDRMSDLILDKGLLTSKPDDQIRNVARTRTLAVLRTLDGQRKGILIRFLLDSKLIDFPTSIIYLEGADLSKAELSNTFILNANFYLVDLSDADFESTALGLQKPGTVNQEIPPTDSSMLNGAKLVRANLRKAFLIGVPLYNTDMRDANLSYAFLRVANLSRADLTNADLDNASLPHANLSGAKLVHANLSNADLSNADLSDASFTGADLTYTDLSNANLFHSNITPEQLATAQTLSGTIMPDGLKHE